MPMVFEPFPNDFGNVNANADLVEDFDFVHDNDHHDNDDDFVYYHHENDDFVDEHHENDDFVDAHHDNDDDFVDDNYDDDDFDLIQKPSKCLL